MRRFFIDRVVVKANSVIIKGDEAHHIRDVIRLKSGDRFLGFDGTDRIYTLRIKKIDDVIEAEIEKVSEREFKMPKILLAVALPKKSKMDDIVEKATELGVSDIVPMVTERTIVKIDEKNRTAKQRRWEKIASEASKQCGRNRLPKIYGITELKDALRLAEDLGYKNKLLPCLLEEAEYITNVMYKKIEDAAIFIGPEGDFSKKEIDYAKNAGGHLVSLGPFVLKVDTACLFTVSIIQGRLSHFY